MSNYVLLLALLLFTCRAHAQKTDGPVAVTPAMVQQINAAIEKEIPALMVRYEKDNNERTDKFDEGIRFAVDTFKIEAFCRKSIDYDYSTAGTSKAVTDAIAKYNVLMRKYYNLLYAKLKPAEKTVLLASQKNWQSYMDKQDLLCRSLNSSVAADICLSSYKDMLKFQTSTLFREYVSLY